MLLMRPELLSVCTPSTATDLGLSSVASPAPFCFCWVVFPSDGVATWMVLYALGRSCLSERKRLVHTALGFEGNRDQDWR